MWFGIAVGVGSMIGAGILRAPADVAQRLPTPLGTHRGMVVQLIIALALPSALVANTLNASASYAMSFASVFVLRRREPHAPRPYRAWGHPWTTGAVLAGSRVFLATTLAASPRDAASVAILLVVSYPAFRLAARRRF